MKTFIRFFVIQQLVTISLGLARTYIDCVDDALKGRSTSLACMVVGTVTEGIKISRMKAGHSQNVVVCNRQNTKCETYDERYSAVIKGEMIIVIMNNFNQVDEGVYACTDGDLRDGEMTCNKSIAILLATKVSDDSNVEDDSNTEAGIKLNVLTQPDIDNLPPLNEIGVHDEAGIKLNVLTQPDIDNLPPLNEIGVHDEAGIKYNVANDVDAGSKPTDDDDPEIAIDSEDGPQLIEYPIYGPVGNDMHAPVPEPPLPDTNDDSNIQVASDVDAGSKPKDDDDPEIAIDCEGRPKRIAPVPKPPLPDTNDDSNIQVASDVDAGSKPKDDDDPEMAIDFEEYPIYGPDGDDMHDDSNVEVASDVDDDSKVKGPKPLDVTVHFTLDNDMNDDSNDEVSSDVGVASDVDDFSVDSDIDDFSVDSDLDDDSEMEVASDVDDFSVDSDIDDFSVDSDLDDTSEMEVASYIDDDSVVQETRTVGTSQDVDYSQSFGTENRHETSVAEEHRNRPFSARSSATKTFLAIYIASAIVAGAVVFLLVASWKRFRKLKVVYETFPENRFGSTTEVNKSFDNPAFEADKFNRSNIVSQ